jgi:hypothetical protein
MQVFRSHSIKRRDQSPQDVKLSWPDRSGFKGEEIPRRFHDTETSRIALTSGTGSAGFLGVNRSAFALFHQGEATATGPDPVQTLDQGSGQPLHLFPRPREGEKSQAFC